MTNQPTQSGGVSGFTLLTLLFIGLKLGHVIDWSWFWVLSPTLIPLGAVLLITTFIMLACSRGGKRL